MKKRSTFLRKNLKLFRVGLDLTQEEFAERIGVSRATYTSIELGLRDGRNDFWRKFQDAFNIPDADLWGYMKNEAE